jgi:hypothetical protein
MSLQTGPTVTELIIRITTRLRDICGRRTSSSVVSWEEAVLGTSTDILLQTRDEARISPLYYCDDCDVIVEKWLFGGGEVLFFERAAARGGVDVKPASLVPHMTSPTT